MKRAKTRVYLAMAWVEQGHQNAIERFASKNGWIVMKWNSKSSAADDFQQFQPHGIICQLSLSTSDLVSAVKAAHTPKISLRSPFPGIPMPRVVPDEEAAGARVAAHLLERGFSRLAFFGNFGDGFLNGFKRTAEAAGAEAVAINLEDPKLEAEIGSRTLVNGAINDQCSPKRRKWIRRFLARHTMPLGVFTQVMTLGEEIVEECRAMRIRVPEQVAVVAGADTVDDGATKALPLTVVVPDYDAQAWQAAELLDRMMKGKKVPVNTVIKVPPIGLVPRASTLCQTSDDPAMARVATFIMSRLHDPVLCAKQVQRMSKMSTSTLYRKFHAHFKMPIADYIERKRLDEARHLLVTTEETAVAIAKKTGFGDLIRFRNAMKRTTGMGPSAYREKNARC